MKPRQVRGIGSRKGIEIKWKRGGLRIRFRSDWLAQLKLLQVLKELRVEGSNVM